LKDKEGRGQGASKEPAIKEGPGSEGRSEESSLLQELANASTIPLFTSSSTAAIFLDHYYLLTKGLLDFKP